MLPHHPELVRPTTFIEGERYVWQPARRKSKNPPLQSVVAFVGYDPCPAFVIVSSGAGRTQRCPRDELYLQLAS